MSFLLFIIRLVFSVFLFICNKLHLVIQVAQKRYWNAPCCIFISSLLSLNRIYMILLWYLIDQTKKLSFSLSFTVRCPVIIFPVWQSQGSEQWVYPWLCQFRICIPSELWITSFIEEGVDSWRKLVSFPSVSSNGQRNRSRRITMFCIMKYNERFPCLFYIFFCQFCNRELIALSIVKYSLIFSKAKHQLINWFASSLFLV